MRFLAAFALLTLGAAAQEVVTLPTGTPRPGAWTGPIHSSTTVEADPQLHANVLTLIGLTGECERLVANFPEILAKAKTALMQDNPGMTPAFANEWQRRMAARINADDFVQLAARVYEKHLTNDEVLSLIALLQAKKASKPAAVSPQLQQKFAAEAPAIMSEFYKVSSELVLRLSTQIDSEIRRDHPEYLTARQPPSRQPGKSQLP